MMLDRVKGSSYVCKYSNDSAHFDARLLKINA